jgi:diguanylate cyclase (GGDEF)-like protein
MLANLLAAFGRSLLRTWSPPGELSPRMRVESRIVIARWFAIAFVAVALPFHPFTKMPSIFAYAVLGVALVYTIALRWLIGRAHASIEDGSLPAAGDVLLCSAMLPILGGFVFPFYAILYLVTISAGIRLGFYRGMLLAVSIAALDATIGMLTGGSLGNTDYIVRTGALLAIVPITAYLHDEAQRNEVDLAKRLRQSQVLNERLQMQALQDQLTGLANRTHLQERVTAALATGEGDLAVLVMGLERFDEVNDTFGHEFGDMLLQHVGERLRTAIGEFGMVARLGGDQFAAALWSATPASAEAMARVVLQHVERTYAIEDCSIEMEARVGFALSGVHGSDAELLLRRADVAMSAAQRAAFRCAAYSPEQDQHSAERFALVPELRRAIEHDELTLWYQPKLDLQTSRCVGVEALVRWNHPQRGLVPPDQFILVAEQTGLIKDLSDWVLRAALKQHREWQDVGLSMPIAVNLSMHDLQNPRLVDRVATLLSLWQVNPADLLIEITESSLMVEPARALETLNGLRALGAGIAVDDFGTGYSSLGYLKRLPVDELKIDRSFVQDLATDADDLAIVRSTINLGHELGLSVTAEGIEDQCTFSLLRELGCDVAQGYYIGKPKPAAELIRELRPEEPPLAAAA